jgi:hypothetical protein
VEEYVSSRGSREITKLLECGVKRGGGVVEGGEPLKDGFKLGKEGGVVIVEFEGKSVDVVGDGALEGEGIRMGKSYYAAGICKSQTRS